MKAVLLLVTLYLFCVKQCKTLQCALVYKMTAPSSRFRPVVEDDFYKVLKD